MDNLMRAIKSNKEKGKPKVVKTYSGKWEDLTDEQKAEIKAYE